MICRTLHLKADFPYFIMLKKWLDIILFSGTIPLGVLFIYSASFIFSAQTDDEFLHSVSITMLLLMLLGVVVIMLFFSNAFSVKTESDRVRSLVKRKVYTIGGDYIGEVVDVLVSGVSIYGLKVLIKQKKRRKVIILNKYIAKFGEVILVRIPENGLK